ncbi:hypothetical protein TC41_2970 [Alicyclobacillus acidocaldarius subsp. acidocaldarius Tc-4-1]|uniref:Uncharacterized protein n=1 Tax=Alicyclobacillus acidocaldarius (strain Tc-4-1) TaxID=1048834 RepID=F8IKU3_ALIAT|nr:hypothetical protein TC41_2970 [Alicyclobacillus acidocaldarius subsp. acidocaldarius Tc-4-1]
MIEARRHEDTKTKDAAEPVLGGFFDHMPSRGRLRLAN